MRPDPAPTPGGSEWQSRCPLGPVHHLRLTVIDVERSRAFYTELLGFQIAMETSPPADDPCHELAVDLLQDGIVSATVRHRGIAVQGPRWGCT
jgi:catechol 2,3-dioxygenase-like lactoylglutathione lyase family enzyme